MKGNNLLYFFGYKTDFFPFLNNPKNLDQSYKKDLSLGIVRKDETCIIEKFHETDLVI